MTTDNPTLPDRIYIDADFDPVEDQGHGGFFIKPFATGKSVEYVRAPVVAPRGDDGGLITTLEAAANYICRASSDYYDASVRDTVIKALTYWINTKRASPPFSPVPPEQHEMCDVPRCVICATVGPPAATPTPVEQEQENRGIKSSALLQRYARMWSSTEGIEKRFSLQDRYIAVRTCVHAIDRLAERDDLPFDVRANAQGILRDGIYNALDHRATGREWRNIRHTYWNERDGPHPPTEAEEDRRCERCGAIRPEPFTHCHAKNHVPAVPPSPSVREAARAAAKDIREWIGISGMVDGEGLNEVAAIIERHCSPVSAAGGDEERKSRPVDDDFRFGCGLDEP